MINILTFDIAFSIEPWQNLMIYSLQYISGVKHVNILIHQYSYRIQLPSTSP